MESIPSSLTSAERSTDPDTRLESEIREAAGGTPADASAVSRQLAESTQLNRFVMVALSMETLLVCIEGAIPASANFLPLAGTHLGQLGLVLGLATASTHLRGVVRKP